MLNILDLKPLFLDFNGFAIFGASDRFQHFTNSFPSKNKQTKIPNVLLADLKPKTPKIYPTFRAILRPASAREKGLELYAAQREAIEAIFEDVHVVLNTPTGRWGWNKRMGRSLFWHFFLI